MPLFLALLANLSPAGEFPRGARASAAEPSAAFSPDGRTLAVLGRGAEIRLWDVASGKQRMKIPLARGADEFPEQVRYTPGGDLAVLLCRYKGFASGPGWARQGTISACLWNVSSGKRSPFIDIGYGGLAVCPEGKLLAYDSGLWDLGNGKKVAQVARPEGLVYDIRFSPGGRAVAFWICESLAQDGSLTFVADAGTGKKLLQVGAFDWDHYRFSWVSRPVFSPNGSAIVCSGPDGPGIKLRELATGKTVQTFPTAEWESVVGLSSDGRTMVTWQQEGHMIRVWETATGKERRAVKAGPGTDAVFLSPDGKTVALKRGGAVEFTSCLPRTHTVSSKRVPQEWEAAWAKLEDQDAGNAYRAIWTFVEAPNQAVPFLREHLQSIRPVDPYRISRYIADLDSERFSIREEAVRELEAVGDLAGPALRKALRNRPSLDKQRHLERLLSRVEGPVPPANCLRDLRAIEVLEQIGTADAQNVLTVLAGGAAQSRVTREAKASVERLARTHVGGPR